jgi:hypothetical protein
MRWPAQGLKVMGMVGVAATYMLAGSSAVAMAVAGALRTPLLLRKASTRGMVAFPLGDKDKTVETGRVAPPNPAPAPTPPTPVVTAVVDVAATGAAVTRGLDIATPTLARRTGVTVVTVVEAAACTRAWEVVVNVKGAVV